MALFFHEVKRKKKPSGGQIIRFLISPQVLPNGKFSDRRMNNLLSEGYLAAERFVIFQKLAEDQKLQRDLLSQSLQSRHLEDWFFKGIQREISRLEEKPAKEWEDHLELYQLHRRRYHHPNSNPRGHSGKPTILKMDEHLDLVYLLEKATLITEKIIRNRVYKNENHEVIEEVKKWKIACANIKHPAIEFYQMRFDYTEENMVEQYFKLREAFLDRYEELNEKEQKVHLGSLLNDTISLIRKSFFETHELLPLYKIGLITGILLNKGILNYRMYSSIVASSNFKGDFEYTGKFIKEYTGKLEQQFQQDAINWANANTLYNQKDFIKSLDLLEGHNYKVLYFKFLKKILTCQSLFDLYLIDDSYQFYLFNYFDSFEKWIMREKFQSRFTKKSYLRFVQVSRHLAKSFSDVNFDSNRIKNILDNEENIQASKWISNKIELVISLKTKRPLK